MVTLAEGNNPLTHVLWHNFLWSEDGYVIWNTTIGNLLLSLVIFLPFMVWVAKHIETGSEGEGTDRYVTKNPIAHAIEVICVFLREETVRPLLHGRTNGMMPFLWTIFFFILFHNLLGLVPLLDLIHLVMPGWRAQHISPIGGTATQNLLVTASLSAIAALVINISGIRALGFGGYLAHLTGGAPAYIWPIIIPVEILGILIKPTALAIRLFANMTAGHTLIATLLMFVMMVFQSFNLILTPSVTLVSALAMIPIYFLEIFVAFLQAYVFMFLTTVFIAQLDHHHDHDEHGEAAAAH